MVLINLFVLRIKKAFDLKKEKMAQASLFVPILGYHLIFTSQDAVLTNKTLMNQQHVLLVSQTEEQALDYLKNLKAKSVLSIVADNYSYDLPSTLKVISSCVSFICSFDFDDDQIVICGFDSQGLASAVALGYLMLIYDWSLARVYGYASSALTQLPRCDETCRKALIHYEKALDSENIKKNKRNEQRKRPTVYCYDTKKCAL